MASLFGGAIPMMLAAMAFAGMLCPVIAVAADESSSIILAERGNAPDRAVVISATAGESQRYAAEELRHSLPHGISRRCGKGVLCCKCCQKCFLFPCGKAHHTRWCAGND